MDYSNVQKEIINFKGNLIVSASAGTGKTSTMLGKIENDIRNNTTHKSVAAITFTIKATREIKDRLSINTSDHYIGTNNSFAIEEVIRPFFKDVFTFNLSIDISTNYEKTINSFDEGLNQIKTTANLCSYENNKNNFVFELALKVLTNSKACRLYLKSKYFKIYIDEYQDCDLDMHEFFMYIANELMIETFIIGDPKQSIYIWRGANPQNFQSILENNRFQSKFLYDNFRSCYQIQNYANLLISDTRFLYKSTENLNNIIWIKVDKNSSWSKDVLKHIDESKTSALIRYQNKDAEKGANCLNNEKATYTFIPNTPISYISSKDNWLYYAIVKFYVVDKYSIYDFIDAIPPNLDYNKEKLIKINELLISICNENINLNKDMFFLNIIEIANIVGVSIKKEHIQKLIDTIADTKFHSAFTIEKYNHIAITLHKSKGLEFEQVIIFAEDYELNKLDGIYNHYVAVTRAKKKLIIVRTATNAASNFTNYLELIFNESNLGIKDLVKLDEKYNQLK